MIVINLDLVDVPFFAVWDFDRVKHEVVNVRVVVVLVHLVIFLALWYAYGMRGHCSKNDVDELDIKRTH